ncbi:MAG: hypothetical protein RIR97_1165 [Pseudomonadota bacterium]
MMFTGTLSRYFFKRYCATMGWYLAGVLVFIFLVDFSSNSSRLSSLEGLTMGVTLYLTLLRLPLILQQTIPFITLFVGMTTLVALNRKYELVVVRAAGISVWQFLLPLMAGALITGLLTSLVINPLAAWGTREALKIQPNMLSGNTAAAPWFRQISPGEDLIIGAKTNSDGGTTLQDATIVHFDAAHRITLRQDAKTAKLKDGYWILNDVTETNSNAETRKLAVVKIPTRLKKEFVQESQLHIETIAFYEIPQKMLAAASFGMSTKALQTQLQSVIALPVLLVAMTLIAACVSLQFSRFNQSGTLILGGILCGFVLYVVTVLVKAFGSSGIVPPFVAAWIPVVVAVSLGAAILLHQEDG